MPEGSVVLFEDEFVSDMYPITLTRPAFAVTCGALNLYDVARMVGERVGYVVRDYLADTTACLYADERPAAGPTLMLNAALAPDARHVARLRALLAAGEPFLCTTGRRVAAALVPAGVPLPDDLSPATAMPWLLERGLPLREEEGLRTFDYPFHLIGVLEELFPANLQARIAAGGLREVRPGVFVGTDVDLAETAVVRADKGPVVLDDGVQVMEFAYLVGPLYVGPHSRIIERASVKESVSIGRLCKIGGEVEASVIESHTNKQHHGFLGHAYVGSWVNLGAGTSNSDLKNTYGTVRVEHQGRKLDTGLQFLGCVIGDFSKSAINTSIFTGKIIGVSSMLYGFVGQNVPSFCNYARSFGQMTECTIDQAVTTQRRMFARRSIEQTVQDVALLRAVHERTRSERCWSTLPPVL
ncbi:MAG: glucose-1-phosphate thymidylyltransferase [Candidatus Brocadiaceae bacterium]|nr:glucose-1-phosphate thymidylyltransferase [Candidatus Brocadiaceae bacterium]